MIRLALTLLRACAVRVSYVLWRDLDWRVSRPCGPCEPIGWRRQRRTPRP